MTSSDSLMPPPGSPTSPSRFGARFMRWLVACVCLGGILLLLYLDGLLHQHPTFSLEGESVNYSLLFFAGLFTGFHCVGMCGALVVGYCLKNGNEPRPGWGAHLLYGFGKTLSYTTIGALFGALGAIVTFTPWLRGMAGIIAGVFLVIFGLSVINPASTLHRWRFKTPGALMRFIGQAYRRYRHPFVIGLLNGLMVICGPLQALYIMAAGTGSPVAGAKLLLAFGLGTLPVMMGFGALASGVSSRLAPRIVQMSGGLVMVLGIIMLNRGLAMTGSGWDFASLQARLLTPDIVQMPVEKQPAHAHEHHGTPPSDLPEWARKLNEDIAAWLENWRTARGDEAGR